MTTLPLVAELQVSRLQAIGDDTGTLLVAESGRQVPFAIARTFVVTGVAAGAMRGHHAHKRCQQLLVCLSGRISVLVYDGSTSRTLVLAGVGESLYIPPGIWAEQVYEASGSILMVLCDQPYDEADYLRDYEGFLAWRANGGKEQA